MKRRLLPIALFLSAALEVDDRPVRRGSIWIALFVSAAIAGCTTGNAALIGSALPISCSGNPCTATLPASGGTLVLPASGGFTANLTLPAPSTDAGAVLTTESQTTLPAGLPVLQSGARHVLSDTPAWYFSIEYTQGGTVLSSSAVSFTTSYGLQILVPFGAASGLQYFIAECVSSTCTSWELAALGPATVTANAGGTATLTFPPVSGLLSFNLGVTYWFVLYTAPTPTGTPTPGASPSPSPGGSASPSPTPGGSASPSPTPGGSASPSPTPTPATGTIPIQSVPRSTPIATPTPPETPSSPSADTSSSPSPDATSSPSSSTAI